jgi:hypothetical protein
MIPSATPPNHLTSAHPQPFVTPHPASLSTLTLTAAELQELTGAKRPKRIASWLDDRGWVYEPPARRGDVPKVDRTYYLARMSGQAPGPKRIGPRLDFMLSL